MVDTAASIWRDFETDGNPLTGKHKPKKAKIREWGTWVEGKFTDLGTGINSRIASVDRATTGNITLSGEQTIDGGLTSASRVLVLYQTTASQNGIYTTGAGSWTRVADANTASKLNLAAVYVLAGTSNGGNTFLCTIASTATLGTDACPWVLIDRSAAGDIATEEAARIAGDASVTAAFQAADLLKAPLASPAFTGSPTAPTPAPGDNDTSIATTAFVKAAVDVEAAARLAADNSEAATRSAADLKRQLIGEAIERPGDARECFTYQNYSGAANDMAPLALGTEVTVAGLGRVISWVSTAASYDDIVARQDVAVEPGKLGNCRWVFQRTTNSSDPAGDAVECWIAWLDKDKALLSSSKIGATRTPTTFDSRIEVKGTYSPDLTADVVPASGACYARPFLRIYRNTGVTAIAVIESRAPSGAAGPKGDTGDVTLAAQTARDEAVTAAASASASAAKQFNATRQAVSSNTTIDSSFNGKTIRFTAAALTLTVPLASSLPDDFQVFLVNPMADAAVRVVPTSSQFQAFWLWPGQRATVYRSLDGATAVLEVDKPNRYRPIGGETFFVATTGDDTNNDGLSASRPFATVQQAINTISQYIDHDGAATTIKCAAGIFADSFVHTFPIVGYHVIYIEGASTSDPTQTVWRLPGNGGIMAQARDFCALVIRAVQISSLGTGSIGLSASQWGIIDAYDIHFGSMAGGICMQSTNGGSVGYSNGGILNRIKSSCSAVWSVSARSGMIVTSCTITVDAVAFSSYAVVNSNGTIILAGVTFVDNSVSGTKYSVSLNGTIISNGITLPGPSAGTTATGGQYA